MIRNLLALTGLVAIALITAIGLRASGYFDDDGDGPPPRIAVSYAGLDLSTDEGVGLLERRINAAIVDVCPHTPGAHLQELQQERACRRRAAAMVGPQVERAIAAAHSRGYAPAPRYADDDPGTYDDPGTGYDRANHDPGTYDQGGYDRRDSDSGTYDDVAERAVADRALPPYPAPRPTVATPAPEAALPPGMRRRLIRRTVTTTVVRSSPGVPTTTTTTTAVRKPVATAKRVVAEHKRQRSTAYARRPSVPGSWLPPAAWRAIDRANARAFALGRLTRWASPGRSGYVTISAARRIGGATCRNLRAVKQAGGRQIVVAEGTLCRTRNGRITARHCP